MVDAGLLRCRAEFATEPSTGSLSNFNLSGPAWLSGAELLDARGCRLQAGRVVRTEPARADDVSGSIEGDEWDVREKELPFTTLIRLVALLSVVTAAWRHPSPASETRLPVPDRKEQVRASREEATAGAGATGPSEIPAKGWWNVLRRAFAGFSSDRVMANAAGVTFYALLAMFPALAALISIYGLFADTSHLQDQVQGMSGLLPGGGISIIKGEISSLTSNGRQALGWAAIIGLLTSLWSANAGLKAFFDALNVVYHEQEKRSFVRLTFISMMFTLSIIAFVIVAMSIVVIIPIVLNFIGLGTATDLAVRIIRWPILLVIVALLLAFLYRFGPSRRPARWQWVTWGSGFATILWVAVSLGFSFYVANFGSYNKTYGSLGAVVGFMTWIWISSIVVLMGGEINAELEQQTQRDSTEGPEKPPGLRGAYKADVKT
jgi:membrane protein